MGVAGKCRAARILHDGAFTIQLRHDRRIMRLSFMSNKFTLSDIYRYIEKQFLSF